jgi:hypothetical protein
MNSTTQTFTAVTHTPITDTTSRHRISMPTAFHIAPSMEGFTKASMKALKASTAAFLVADFTAAVTAGRSLRTV